MRQRRPDAAARCARELAAAHAAAAPSLRAAEAAGAALDADGWTPFWGARRPLRLHPTNRQRPGIGFVAGRDRQLAYSTRRFAHPKCPLPWQLLVCVVAPASLAAVPASTRSVICARGKRWDVLGSLLTFSVG